jgi:hypothetical protein
VHTASNGRDTSRVTQQINSMVQRVGGENHVIDWNGARYDCAFRRRSTAATDETSQGNDGPDIPKLVGNAHQVSPFASGGANTSVTS